MKNFFYYFQITLIILIGFCGLTLLIGGFCVGSLISSLIGAAALILPVITWIDKKKNLGGHL